MKQNDLDIEIALERIRQLEENIYELSTELANATKLIAEMQRVIVRVATSQQQVVERVKMWPYVRADKNSIDPEQ